MFRTSERGNSLVIFAICIPVFMGFAAISIDGGVMLYSHVELQSAVDAAALAGSSALLIDQEAARSRAVAVGSANTVFSTPVTIAPEDISFPTASQIRIDLTHTLPLYFARLIGMNETTVQATTTAQINGITGTAGLLPWTMPAAQFSYGAEIRLNVGQLEVRSDSLTTFYAVCYPPANRGTPVAGASAYEENIMNGAQMVVYVGDELLVQPGNMLGPTRQGVEFLMDSDPGAYWDGTAVVNSAFPGYSSPRIGKISFFDPADPPDIGRERVTIIGLGAFFLEGMQGNDVVGRFIKIITSGVTGTGSMGLYSVRLIS